MPEIIVLDTHIWLWFVNNNLEKIPPAWVSKITETERVSVSPVSCYELALANSKGRLSLSMPVEDWFEIALNTADISLLPLIARVAARAVGLSPIHKDPFDRIIMSTVWYTVQD